MSTILMYKGYTGSLQIDIEANLLFGRVIDLTDVITFQGATVEEARQAFHDSVEDYLAYCAELGQEPERPFSGKLLFRTTPERHRRIFVAASHQGKSVNAWIDEVLAEAADHAMHKRNPVIVTEADQLALSNWRIVYDGRYYRYEDIGQLLEASSDKRLVYAWASLAEHLSRRRPDGVDIQRDNAELTGYFSGTAFSRDWENIVAYLMAHADELKAVPL
jgi:predicted HicB family RNase H-like nuclease